MDVLELLGLHRPRTALGALELIVEQNWAIGPSVRGKGRWDSIIFGPKERRRLIGLLLHVFFRFLNIYTCYILYVYIFLTKIS